MTGILLENNDLDIKVQRNQNGRITRGLVLGDVLYQNQALILQMHKGELKERPAVGVGIEDMLMDNDYPAWRQSIREQLEMDGQKVNTVKINRDGIVIDATY